MIKKKTSFFVAFCNTSIVAVVVIVIRAAHANGYSVSLSTGESALCSESVASEPGTTERQRQDLRALLQLMMIREKTE